MEAGGSEKGEWERAGFGRAGEQEAEEISEEGGKCDPFNQASASVRPSAPSFRFLFACVPLCRSFAEMKQRTTTVLWMTGNLLFFSPMRHRKQVIMKVSETREETSPLNSFFDVKATKTTGRVGSFMRSKPPQHCVRRKSHFSPSGD